MQRGSFAMRAKNFNIAKKLESFVEKNGALN